MDFSVPLTIDCGHASCCRCTGGGGLQIRWVVGIVVVVVVVSGVVMVKVVAVVQLVVVMVYRDLADSLKIVVATKAMEHNSPDLVVIDEVLK